MSRYIKFGEYLRVMGKKKVRTRKELANTLMAMKTQGKRIAYSTVIQLPFDPVTKTLVFEEDKTYRVYAKDMAEMCGISLSQAYKQLKEGINELQNTVVKVPKHMLHGDIDFENSPDDLVVMFSVADYCAYSDGEGFVELRFHRKMKYMISELTRNYTTQYLLSAVRLPIGNANNLYLLLREKISDGKTHYFDIEFEEIKERLNVSEISRYESYQYFNSDYFKRSSKQIIEKTEFSEINIEIIQRVKRKAHKLRISYVVDENYYQPKNLKEAAIVEASKADNGEDKRRFTDSWYTQKEAKELGLKWKNGLTLNQFMEFENN